MSDSDRITSLERSVKELDDTLGALIQAIPAIEDSQGGAVGSTNSDNSVRDSVWECAGCSARLGIYNEERCELRVRYKDFLIYIVPGREGSTSIPCRRCGHMNVIRDDGTGATSANQ